MLAGYVGSDVEKVRQGNGSGTRIGYQKYFNGGTNIWILNLLDNSETQVTFEAHQVWDPVCCLG